MRDQQTERYFVTIATAVAVAMWAFVGAGLAHVSIAVAAICAVVGAGLAGAGMCYRYRNGYRTEVETAAEASTFNRLTSAILMGLLGLGGGFDIPWEAGLGWAPSLATAATGGFLLGRFAWRHPALFYKNRQFCF